jgi:hypothetical protein
MKKILFSFLGVLGIILGTVAVVHYETDSSVVQAEPNC